jgi:hypothetical protein
MLSFKKSSKILPLLAFLCLIVCCKSKTVKVPEGVVVPDTMVQVLADVHIYQASTQMGFNQTSKDSSTNQGFVTMLKKHHMTEADYHTSLSYYLDHPSLLDSIYDKVLNNLSQQKAELMGKKNR